MAETNSPPSGATEQVATGSVVNLPIKQRRTRRSAKEAATTNGKVLQISQTTKAEAAHRRDRADVQAKLVELLMLHADEGIQGLMFTIDLGNGCHEYAFTGSYARDPESAFMPAAQTLRELSGEIYRK
jgi:hypothetical protein